MDKVNIEPHKCKMTAQCCKRLLPERTFEILRQIQSFSKEQKKNGNYTKKFLAGWMRGAKKAMKEDKALFQCEFLENNLCSLQKNKPQVCSYSLSEDAFESNRVFDASDFFHHTCGFLDGQPEELKELVKLAWKWADYKPSERLKIAKAWAAYNKTKDELMDGYEYKYYKGVGWKKEKIKEESDDDRKENDEK